MATTSRRGVFFSALAFTTWGCLPLFWRLLEAASPLDILAHRIVWSLPFAMGLTVLLKKPRVWEIFRSRDTFLSVLLSGSLIGVNWGLYIWAINSGMTVEASLGYYMNPLFTMA
ncbi:MAG TPA: EamA family transporter, partial [Holophaga sp.]|nr:EamA family transporter [Holophaga sp.]